MQEQASTKTHLKFFTSHATVEPLSAIIVVSCLDELLAEILDGCFVGLAVISINNRVVG